MWNSPTVIADMLYYRQYLRGINCFPRIFQGELRFKSALIYLGYFFKPFWVPLDRKLQAEKSPLGFYTKPLKQNSV